MGLNGSSDLPSVGGNVDGEVIRPSEVHTGATTMYVRPSGDDSNSGTSADDAKATIEAAVRDAPVNGNLTQRLVIDLDDEGGTITPGSGFNTTDWQLTNIVLRGQTGGTANAAGGDPNTTLDLSNLGAGETWAYIRYCRFEFANLIVQNAPGSILVNGPEAVSGITNCTFEPNDSGIPVRGFGGRVTLGGNSVVKLDASVNGAAAAWEYQDAGGKLFGHVIVTAGGCTNVVNLFDGSRRVDINGATIDGNDASQTSRIMRIQSARHVKIDSSCSFKNAGTYIAGANGGSEVIHQNGKPSFTNVNNTGLNQAGTHVGSYGSDAEDWIGLPRINLSDNPGFSGINNGQSYLFSTVDDGFLRVAHSGISEFVGPVTIPGARDLTAASAPAPNRQDVFAIDDGSSSGSPGLYRSDGANNQWVKVEDNTVTIAY